MLTDQMVDQLFSIEKKLRAAGMGDLSAEELRGLAQKIIGQPQGTMNSIPGPGGGLMPTSTGANLPIAGFQGNQVFPNASGVAASPMADFNERLNPMGQSIQKPMGMMGQGQPSMMAQGGGFDTHVHIGADGQLKALNIKRAMQKKMQQGGMA